MKARSRAVKTDGRVRCMGFWLMCLRLGVIGDVGLSVRVLWARLPDVPIHCTLRMS